VFESATDASPPFKSQRTPGERVNYNFDYSGDAVICIDQSKSASNPSLERLDQALPVLSLGHAVSENVFCGSVCLSSATCHPASAPSLAREARPLQQWRLNRAFEFMDAHLTESIRLADIARSTGLTRMHFASQFRRATGMRPREYLLRRRIELAKRLLIESRYNVLDVALSCGFHSQAHFTTTFKRYAGATPYCWRVRTNAIP
jgi:AraC family transcriptional regulator